MEHPTLLAIEGNATRRSPTPGAGLLLGVALVLGACGDSSSSRAVTATIARVEEVVPCRSGSLEQRIAAVREELTGDNGFVVASPMNEPPTEHNVVCSQDEAIEMARLGTGSVAGPAATAPVHEVQLGTLAGASVATLTSPAADDAVVAGLITSTRAQVGGDRPMWFVTLRGEWMSHRGGPSPAMKPRGEFLTIGIDAGTGLVLYTRLGTEAPRGPPPS